jgi:hypothetical protein
MPYDREAWRESGVMVEVSDMYAMDGWGDTNFEIKWVWIHEVGLHLMLLAFRLYHTRLSGLMWQVSQWWDKFEDWMEAYL